MRAVITLAIATVAFAGPASSQTTTCGWELGKWVCRTDPPPPNIADFHFTDAGTAAAETIRRVQAARAARAQAVSQDEADRHQAHMQWVHEQVATAIREHRCTDARAIALEASDLDLAEQAVRLCQ